LARALGMGVDELADTLVKQDQLNKLTVGARIENERNVKLAEMERTEREKTAQNIENLKKTFFSFTNGPIATVIKGFNSVMEGINNSPMLKSIIGFAGGAAALLALGAGLTGAIRLLFGVFKKGAIPVTIVGTSGISSSSGGGSIGGGGTSGGTGIGGNLKNLFKGGRAGKVARGRTLQTLGKGVQYNNATGALDPGASNSDGSLVSGSADNIRWEIQNVNNQLGTFTLLVRQGNDNTNNPIVLETFTNLNLDPASDNYIEKVIGNQFMTVGTDSSTGVSYTYLQGTYPNRSNYIT
jgi:hypothetical protein